MMKKTVLKIVFFSIEFLMVFLTDLGRLLEGVLEVFFATWGYFFQVA